MQYNVKTIAIAVYSLFGLLAALICYGNPFEDKRYYSFLEMMFDILMCVFMGIIWLPYIIWNGFGALIEEARSPGS